MKKKITKVIAVLMLFVFGFGFTACDASDMKFMALMIGGSTIESSRIQGETTIEIPNFSSFEGGTTTISLSYDGKVIQRMDYIYLDIDIRYGINDANMSGRVNILIKDEDIFIPIQDFVELILIYYRYISPFPRYSEEMLSQLEAAFRNEFTEEGYVVISGVMGMMSSDMPATMNAGLMMSGIMGITNTQINEMIHIAMDSFSRMFEGFSSGMTRIDGNAVTLEITPENAWELFQNAVEHMRVNRSLIFTETLILLDNLGEAIDAGDSMRRFIQMARVSLQESRQDFYDAIDDMARELATIDTADVDEMLGFFEGSYLRYTISQEGNVFHTTLEAALQMNMGGGLMSERFVIRDSSTMTPMEVERRSPTSQNIIYIDDLIGRIDVAYNRVNQVNSVEVSWFEFTEEGRPLLMGEDWEEDGIRAHITGLRAEGFGSSWLGSEYIIVEEDAVYVPLRIIAESLGEHVGWERETRTAYILRENERIKMPGKLIHSRTFIEARKFEMLGYTVELTTHEDPWFTDSRLTISRD